MYYCLPIVSCKFPIIPKCFCSQWKQWRIPPKKTNKQCRKLRVEKWSLSFLVTGPIWHRTSNGRRANTSARSLWMNCRLIIQHSSETSWNSPQLPQYTSQYSKQTLCLFHPFPWWEFSIVFLPLWGIYTSFQISRDKNPCDMSLYGLVNNRDPYDCLL